MLESRLEAAATIFSPAPPTGDCLVVTDASLKLVSLSGDERLWSEVSKSFNLAHLLGQDFSYVGGVVTVLGEIRVHACPIGPGAAGCCLHLSRTLTGPLDPGTKAGLATPGPQSLGPGGFELDGMVRVARRLGHDFGNMLGGVMACVELAQERLDRDSPAAEDMNAALGALELSRSYLKRLMRSCGVAASGERFDAASRASRVVEKLRRDLHPEVELVYHGLPAPLCLAGDASAFDQMLAALVKNGEEACLPGGGAVTVRLGPAVATDQSSSWPPAWLTLEVADTGRGMDDSTRRMAFEPLFSTRTAQGGWGLGLTLVWATARAFGGQASLESVPGRGTVARVTIPVQSHSTCQEE